MGRHQGVDLSIGTPRVVVEQRELPGAGATAYSIAEWPRKPSLGSSGRGVLGIVDEQVGVAGQRDAVS